MKSRINSKRQTRYRKSLFKKQDGRCHWCGTPMLRGLHTPKRTKSAKLLALLPWGMTIEHLIPLSLGGGNRLANLRGAHRFCNENRPVLRFPHDPIQWREPDDKDTVRLARQLFAGPPDTGRDEPRDGADGSPGNLGHSL